MRRSVFARCRAVLFATAAAVVLVTPLAAQTDVTTSRVSGTVKDTGGGVLPGATVEAKNESTGLLATAVVRTDGFYQVINLPPGPYTLTASISGFRPSTRDSVRSRTKASRSSCALWPLIALSTIAFPMRPVDSSTFFVKSPHVDIETVMSRLVF